MKKLSEFSRVKRRTFTHRAHSTDPFASTAVIPALQHLSPTSKAKVTSGPLYGHPLQSSLADAFCGRAQLFWLCFNSTELSLEFDKVFRLTEPAPYGNDQIANETIKSKDQIMEPCDE